MLNYREAIEYIHTFNRFGTKLGLANISKLLEIIENPHKGIKIIHVAGTNGKGSTCSMIESILRAAGYKVGLYTSPYLEIFNERIRLNGVNIGDSDIVRLIKDIKHGITIMEQQGHNIPTEFEVVTALGFLYFKEKKVDFIVLEVGMGGRLDATNVVKPLVSVITPISYDHQQYLGETLQEIANEKCGIIKPDTPVVTAEQEAEAMSVICDTCLKNKCHLTAVSNSHVYGQELRPIKYRVNSDNLNGIVFDLETPEKSYKSLEIKMLGLHQAGNAAVAVGAVEALSQYGIQIGEEAIYTGLKSAKWPGRLETMGNNPILLIDGAHNLAGIKTLKDALERYFGSKTKILVLGILKDKDYFKMVKELTPIFDLIIATSPDSPRALSAEELKEAILESFKSDDIESCSRPRIYARQKIHDAVALSLQNAAEEDLVVFAGSLYMIGSVRSILKKDNF
jgi:dihydrofolate synthase/folylpolyglutamate synthase